MSTKRTRSRGKKRTAPSPAVQQPAPQKDKKKAHHAPGASDKAKKRAKQQDPRRPWLLPLLVFLGAALAGVLALYAASQK